MIQDRPGTPLSGVCSFSSERLLGTTIIRLYGEFDLSSEELFDEELKRLLDAATGTLVVDLRGLTFMDSTGLRALVMLRDRSTRDGFDYAVLCDGGNVGRVIQAAALDGLLPMVDTSGVMPPA